MKTPVAVTLIVMGALLIMTAVFSENLYQCNVVALKLSGTGVSLRSQMGETIQFCCWLTGSGMVAIAIFRSLLSKTSSEDHSN